MRITRCILLICVVVHTSSAYRYSLTVHPLVNQSRDSLYEWVSHLIPEYFSRSLNLVEGIRVWDPVFMFQTDSLGWRMDSDSLLHAHCNRWECDAAIGGLYTINRDTVTVRLKIVWVTGIRQKLDMTITRKAPLAEVAELAPELLFASCRILKINLTADDSLRISSGTDLHERAYQTFCRGYGFELSSRYAEALTAYNHAIDLNPSFIVARCRTGSLYLRTGNLDEAQRVFGSILKSKHHTNATRAMTAAFAVDNYTPARSYKIIERYRKGLEATAGGLTIIGKWYMTTGAYQRAIAMFRRAIAWGPSNLDTEFLLAMTSMYSGEYSSATDLFNHLISVRPDYLRYQVSLGAVYRRSQRYMESLAVLEAARKKEPENSMILIELAHTSFALSWYRKAGQLLEQARRLRPDQNDILIDLGIVYWHEGRVEDSERCFMLAARETKGKRAVMVNMGNMHLMQGEINKAIKAYKKAGKTGKQNPEILYNMAIAYMKKGRKKAAAKYLDQLLQLTPGRVDLLAIRAELARLLGKNEDAEMAYHKILENDPYNAMAVEGLVKLCIEEGLYEEAIYRVESYLEVKPARGDFMMLLGDAYRKQGWYEVALVKYELVTQAFPDYAPGYLGIARSMYDMVVFKNFSRYDEVLFALKKAGGMMPDNPDPDEMMGDIYWNYRGDVRRAVEHWKNAAAKTSDARTRKKIMKKVKKATTQ